ncbi:TetR/AcrR family transcriptional regulator C-terminal domain-containing protein [Thermoactinospora rubra]|uniref:TetR/AcrR family transcriptional regulator C-terminal domain-containing protein n=1 Tax=Thermoactinospora rubra TaxID=1088767 RepID=UPI000A10649C|nr:TetR/AcrR family transcriptional regulator C-terminal domain-containing protein [Thermoactinospora rubra]
MHVFAGQGDASRSMALLWGPPPEPRRAPGPRPTLTLDAIVAAAIEVADAGSLAGLSMRTVAERLGCSSMALYTYVPGKAELLDLMYDRAHAELLGEARESGTWREAVTAWAHDLRAFYLRHPWVVQVSYARPVLGPNEQAVLERLLEILEGAGLPARTLRGVVSTLFHYVRGNAQTAAEARQAASATGVPDQQWWIDRASRLAKLAPDFAERFPRSARLSRETSGIGHPAAIEDVFTVGLAVLLDGIEAASR